MLILLEKQYFGTFDGLYCMVEKINVDGGLS